jgi:geranylgeranyl diphosphate synthase, type I
MNSDNEIFKNNLKQKISEVESNMKEIMPNVAPETVYELCWDFLNRGGKRVRPYLMLTMIEAFNGDYKRGLEIASGVEIFHNFTLIHDDIEDGSELRRGKPCIHISHGIPLAINAGDGMFVHVIKAISESKISCQEKQKVLEMLSHGFIQVLNGQGYELGWIHNNEWNLTEEDYFKMAIGKTGELIATSAKVGAFLGGANEDEILEMESFGLEIGLAFQIQDDVLNLIGEEEKYKKEIGGDIREGKRTLIVMHALKNLNEQDKGELVKILSDKENTKEEIDWAINKMKETNSINYAKDYAEELVEKAKKRLNLIVKNNDKKRELGILADMFVKRDV